MEGGLSLNSGDKFGTPGGRSFGLSERTPGAHQVLSDLPALKPGPGDKFPEAGRESSPGLL